MAGDLERDDERVRRIQGALTSNALDAIVCTLPSNVLLVSGYWPVIGTAIAIATGEGAVALLVPEDEIDLARHSWANEIHTFQGGCLESLASTAQKVPGPLGALGKQVGLDSGSVIGFEGSASFDPLSYASTFVYGAALRSLLSTAFPSCTCTDATPFLEQLQSVLTSREVHNVRIACETARQAFVQAPLRICKGVCESEVASVVRGKLLTTAEPAKRSDGFVYCMSGPNSAQAYAAYQRSSSRAIQSADFVLLHCNSYCGGFWTDITRTFIAGNAEIRTMKIMDAVLEASRTAITAVRPGVRAAAVDRAARHVLEKHGFAKEFRHATGHGVGFAAINHNALPRIHPLSEEILEPGMVFNIEPGVYIPGFGGMRHCDMVLVTDGGTELLTPFLSRTEQLVLPEPG